VGAYWLAKTHRIRQTGRGQRVLWVVVVVIGRYIPLGESAQ
jgi:hypothetical protein